MPRIVSKRELAGYFAVYIGAIIVALILGLLMINDANAAANKHVVTKREYWSAIRNYSAPDNSGTGTHIESYTVSIETNYLFWPDGNSVNKVAVMTGTVCYHRNSGNGSLFQGVNSNPYYKDDTSVVNPGAVEVPDDGTANNCTSWNIPVTSREWMRMDQDAGWFATGKVRIRYFPDDNFHYKWGGQEFRFFTPGDDPEISEWFYCECDYGGANK